MPLSVEPDGVLSSNGLPWLIYLDAGGWIPECIYLSSIINKDRYDICLGFPLDDFFFIQWLMHTSHLDHLRISFIEDVIYPLDKR